MQSSGVTTDPSNIYCSLGNTLLRAMKVTGGQVFHGIGKLKNEATTIIRVHLRTKTSHSHFSDMINWLDVYLPRSCTFEIWTRGKTLRRGLLLHRECQLTPKSICQLKIFG